MKSQKNLLNLNLLTSAKALIVLRIIIITITLGTVIVFQSNQDKSYPLAPLTLIIITTYLLTICYAISLRYIKKLRILCYVQIIGDLLIESTVIFTTGGIESAFSFLYILSIISASIALIKPANYIAASLASILYGTIAYFDFFDIIQPLSLYSLPTHEGIYFLYKVFLNISAFFLVAYLSGYLGEQWRVTGKELKIKSENLEELQTFHENIVKSMSSGLITTDFDGRITSFNRAATTITGFDLFEIVGTSIYSFLSFLKSDQLSHHTLKKENSPFRAEGYLRRKDKKNIYIGISTSLLKSDRDNAKGLIITFQDLTSMKEMEKKVARAERFAAIGQVSAGMAHEIRNPLASMSGSIQVLKDELQLDGSNRQLMNIVLKETDRLNSIITQFLNYASPRPVTMRPCDINDLIQETIILLKNSKEYQKNITIVTSFHEKVIIEIDKNQIKQVLINLLINSFHAMPSGGRLTIATNLWDPVERGNHLSSLKITFIDDGCGMSKETLQRVFDPFYTTKDKGTGLGLAVVYRIVDEHKGTIEISSEQGKGTSIHILLPL